MSLALPLSGASELQVMARGSESDSDRHESLTGSGRLRVVRLHSELEGPGLTAFLC